MSTLNTFAWGTQGGTLFDCFPDPVGVDVDRFRTAFLVALLAGPTTADEVRQRARVPGNNKIGIAVHCLRRRGLIERIGYQQATAKSARSRLTRIWQLTERGRAEAQRLAGQRPAGAA